MPKTYSCCYCKQKFNRYKLPKHMEKHADEIPENLTTYQVAYDIINNHPDHHGRCVICSKKTLWNEKHQKYNRICDSKSCSEVIKKTYQNRMMKVYNKPHLMDDPNHLEKMLAHRKISGEYIWSDGTKFTYTGSYEKNFLEFLDKVMGYDSKEIISPGPVLEYDYGGKKHKWITDVMILPYNLIVEIKDGGNNKNGNKAWKSTREKTVAKEVMITNLGKYNYIRLTNNDFAQFFTIIAELKMQIVDDTVSPIYRIHEDTSLDEAFEITKIFANMVKDEFKAGVTGYESEDHPVKLKFGDRLEKLIGAPFLAAMGIPMGLGADVIVAIVKALSKIYDYKEAHKTITQKDIDDLGLAIDKIKKSLKDEEDRYKDIYEDVMKGKHVYLEKALPGLISIYNIPEDKMINQLYNHTVEELFDYEDIHFKDKDFKEKYSGKKIGYLTYKYGDDGMLYCYDTKEWFIICFDVVKEPVIQSKALSYKEMYKKLQDILWSEHKDYKNELSKLEKKYKEYKSRLKQFKEDSLPEAIDNPYMLKEAQEWEHLTHMWGNAIDDIIGNVTNSPFEVNKGSYIDHDPETGKEVCVMRTIRPKAELKNREYRDKLKKQMYHLQQKINKAYNVHPSVVFIQYPIDNTNLTEGLIIGITKTSR